jgi:hypothetical protein
VGPSAGFHTNQLDLQVRSEVQQLLARNFLTHHNLAAQVKPNQMKDCLAEINTKERPAFDDADRGSSP